MSTYTQEHTHTDDPDQLVLPLWGTDSNEEDAA